MDNRGISIQIENFLFDLRASVNVFFNSINWSEVLFYLKIGLVILSLLMIVAIVIVLILKSLQ